MRKSWLILALLALAAGCGDDETNPNNNTGGSGGSAGASGASGASGAAGALQGEEHPDCDPIAPETVDPDTGAKGIYCSLPFPSNYHLADDPTKKSPSGKRVQFGPNTLPKYKGGASIDPSTYHDQDGFSPGQAPMTYLPGATTTGLPRYDDIEASLKDDSPTILIEADTGARVPHFAELDMSEKDEAVRKAEQPLMIRPVVRLKDKTRYIVAIRNVVDGAGKAIEPGAAFKALRDGTPTDQKAIEARRDAYKDIFAKLEAAGVKKEGLQVAWDYTTASKENNTRWLLHMRDDALGKVGEMGPTYTVKAVETENISSNLAARVVLNMKVPLYLDIPGPGGKLVFGDDGMPKQNGEADYEVLLIVPKSTETGAKHGILANGHGLLGDKREGQGGYLAEMCNRHKYVGVAVDFIGFAEDDLGTVVQALSNDSKIFRNVVDRQHQGHLNGQLAMRMMRGRIAKEGLTHEGKQIIAPGQLDPAQSFYRGDSQGGIMGAVYMAISKDVTRGLLGEPGMPYNLLLNRSVDYVTYDLLLKGSYYDMRDRQIVLGLLQMMWDRTEPNGYTPYINDDLLPGTPKHEVLLHVAIGDYQVTPLGAHIMARSLKAKNLSPVNRSIWGLPEDPGPFTGSGIVEYDFALKDSEINTGPKSPSGQDPHDTVRKLDPSYDQSHHFFQTGEIKAFCDGPCDCGEVLASTNFSEDSDEKKSCKAAAK